MIFEKNLFLLKFSSLFIALVIGFKVLTGNAAILATGLLLVAIAVRVGVVPVLVSIALFGLPLLTVVGGVIGLTATQIVIALVCMLSIFAVKKLTKFFVLASSRGIRQFFVWWILLLILYSIYTVGGDGSEYSLYAWQYLIIYGSFYVITGFLAIKSRVSPSIILIISLPIFSFNYVLIDASPLTLSGITHAVLGLRAESGFDAINGARAAGLLLLMPLVIFFCEGLSLRLFPYFSGAVLLSAPLVWYSYSRQVLLAILVVASWVFVKEILLGWNNAKMRKEKIILISAFLITTAFSSILIVDLLSANQQSRLIQDGMETGRGYLWDVSMGLIFENPLLGIGIGGLYKYAAHDWPHNWFLEAWLTLGFLGFILAAISGVVIFKALFARCEGWLAAWILFGFYWLITAQFSADIPRNSILLFFLVFAFCATGMHSKRRNAEIIERNKN